MEKNTVLLNGDWRLYIAENRDCKAYAQLIHTEKELKEKGILPIKGKVPGNFELDMFEAGLIADPFFGTNPLDIQELENRHLWYACNFKAEKCNNLYINFEGVDTFADVYVNGSLIGKCDNMLVEHKLYISEDIIEDNNELLVHIKPTCIVARDFDFCRNLYL